VFICGQHWTSSHSFLFVYLNSNVTEAWQVAVRSKHITAYKRGLQDRLTRYTPTCRPRLANFGRIVGNPEGIFIRIA
jgi:hypothetical protein